MVNEFESSDPPNEKQPARMSVSVDFSLATLKPLQFFDLAYPPQQTTKVHKRTLINAINHLHFKNEYLWAHVRGSSYQNDFLVKVYPGPCLNEAVTCRLPSDIDLNLEHYRLEHLVIEDGKTAIVVPTSMQALNQDSMTAVLAADGYLLSTRKERRLPAHRIMCEFTQGEFCLRGDLIDFSASGFRFSLETQIHVSAPLIDSTKPVFIRMHKIGNMVFEGPCRVVRVETNGPEHILILRPISERKQRGEYFRRKRIRNPRLCLVPTPKAIFEHPLSNKTLSYEISDITSSGFSLYEQSDDTLLMPGLIIPELTLVFGSDILITCAAQVLHAHRKRDRIRFGIAIRDMDLNSCFKLCDILANAFDPHANMSRVTDMDALWDIFFETGFLYPQKYEYISRYRDVFRETYRKLYQEGKDLFFNFTYQQNGKIYGHISAIRAYQRLWMIHHFAARPMYGRQRIGLEVYKHVFNVFDTSCRMPLSKVDHIMFYFRPSSSFNMYFQAGFCQKMNNPQACSMDCFSYQLLPVKREVPSLPEGWTLDTFAADDLAPLRTFYDLHSGGVLLDALAIGRTYPDEEPLEEAYGRLGLLRTTSIHSLKHAGDLKAVFIVDRSDIGVNLSDLLNCIKVLVTDPSGLPWDVLYGCACRLARVYQTEQVPLMIYPSDYLEGKGIACERFYYLWILDARYADTYITYMKKKININPLKLFIRYLKAKVSRERE